MARRNTASDKSTTVVRLRSAWPTGMGLTMVGGVVLLVAGVTVSRVVAAVMAANAAPNMDRFVAPSAGDREVLGTVVAAGRWIGAAGLFALGLGLARTLAEFFAEAKNRGRWRVLLFALPFAVLSAGWLTSDPFAAFVPQFKFGPVLGKIAHPGKRTALFVAMEGMMFLGLAATMIVLHMGAAARTWKKKITDKDDPPAHIAWAVGAGAGAFVILGALLAAGVRKDTHWITVSAAFFAPVGLCGSWAAAACLGARKTHGPPERVFFGAFVGAALVGLAAAGFAFARSMQTAQEMAETPVRFAVLTVPAGAACWVAAIVFAAFSVTRSFQNAAREDQTRAKGTGMWMAAPALVALGTLAAALGPPLWAAFCR